MPSPSAGWDVPSGGASVGGSVAPAYVQPVGRAVSWAGHAAIVPSGRTPPSANRSENILTALRDAQGASRARDDPIAGAPDQR